MSPYLRAGYGRGEAVPVAAVDEDGEAFGDEGDVRAAGDLFVMEPVASEAGGPEGFAERELGAGVFGAVCRHDARNRLTLRLGRSCVAEIADGERIYEK